jgi:type 1 glutamine amidotransferase
MTKSMIAAKWGADRHVTALGTALVGLAGLAAPAAAALTIDCPLRDAPFSTASPLIDILLSPAARAVVDRGTPGLLSALPPTFARTTAPSFASILTLRELAGFSGRRPDSVAPLDSALAAVPVTAADRVARCARYDVDRPDLAIPAGKPRLLLFEKMTGYRDGPSVETAHAAFFDIARRKGWAIVATDKGGAITPATLARFDAVIWNNVSGDVLTLTQRRALRTYVERGGGFLAIHGSGGDPRTFWDWYVDDLIGARFAGHPIAKQFQSARVVIEDKADPIARGLPAEWTMTDEWYSFSTNPRAGGAHVIATLDESSYAPEGMKGQELHMGDHPIAWRKCVGQGRSFYAAIGHRPEGYSEPHYVTMLENGLGWAAGLEGKSCHPDAKPSAK